MCEGLKTAKNSVFAVYALGCFWYILIYLSKVLPFLKKLPYETCMRSHNIKYSVGNKDLNGKYL